MAIFNLKVILKHIVAQLGQDKTLHGNIAKGSDTRKLPLLLVFFLKYDLILVNKSKLIPCNVFNILFCLNVSL